MPRAFKQVNFELKARSGIVHEGGTVSTPIRYARRSGSRRTVRTSSEAPVEERATSRWSATRRTSSAI